LATAVTHRDSRAGDPDLHTHVTVANKMQTLAGAGLSIDGRVLFKANVAGTRDQHRRTRRHGRRGLAAATSMTIVTSSQRPAPRFIRVSFTVR